MINKENKRKITQIRKKKKKKKKKKIMPKIQAKLETRKLPIIKLSFMVISIQKKLIRNVVIA